ncbi:MAG: excinuclease ABC subunit UvrA [Pseudomonadota bacterium]
MSPRRPRIEVSGARQNNLRNLDIDLPLNELIVVTGVSGSGKSSLAFDTIYAEGQRRYVETFSPYARQFLDRMDKPQVDQVRGIPPAIAIDQTNPVRTSRSTVGTMTELNDHLKLLYARAADLYCDACAEPVREDTPQSIWEQTCDQLNDARVAIAFKQEIPEQFSVEEMRAFLSQQGYTKILDEQDDHLVVVQDRLRIRESSRDRFFEAVEAAFARGSGHLQIVDLDTDKVRRYSNMLHCAACDKTFAYPTPSRFSFNSPLGACPTCRGFGRVMGIDMDLVVPDPTATLRDGAIKPIQTGNFAELQTRLVKRAPKVGVDVDKPWQSLTDEELEWVMVGDEYRRGEAYWPGINAVFEWLESKAYKMHVRVLLSRYRSYETCPTCNGARLQPDSLCWRIGSHDLTRRVAPELAGRAPGLNMHELMLLPIQRLAEFFAEVELQRESDEALLMLMDAIRTRIGYLRDTGLGYLTLDRQSRTLSGGEVQRINLTTALGTSLVNTLFVLDEPSIGLHPRDLERINKVLLSLRDAGNTLIVVEHDPAVMLAADRIVDMGPGPGAAGGDIVFNGKPSALAKSKRSPTAPYLTGARSVADARTRRSLDAGNGEIAVFGASQHNLKHVDIKIPLGGLVSVTGVSGSGKSTLIGDILYPALSRHFGRGGPAPGPHDTVTGIEAIDDAIFVDQSPIGKTTRSNPASFVGAFDPIRKRFAKTPLAIERGYKPGTFSFNSGTGRCPTCGGTGFEHVEMQFLSDVYLRCPSCDGKRYRDEVLEVKLFGSDDSQRPRSISDVLELTVSEACEFFSDAPDVLARLQPLIDVGLDYVALGQPVPTLSGGESQRLKLAKHLADAGKRQTGRKLFLFDEPTTGLHFQDVETLLQAFDQLLDAGHSVVVIEHNLDVIGASDWVIDLGPEGGELGGEVLFQGAPDALVRQAENATGNALSAYRRAIRGASLVEESASTYEASISHSTAISIHNAREHNLRSIDVDIPRDRFTAITGVSGSGKSTLAFGILFNEGQRRYLESLNAYARQFVQPASRPDVDAVNGIPPTVAIEQRTSRGGRRSTVGTLTEIYHFLRLLFVKLGTAHCPDCNVPIEPQSVDQVVATLMKTSRGKSITLLAPLVVGRKGFYTDLAKWAANKGFERLVVDGEALDVNAWPRLDRYKTHDIDLPVATVAVTPEDEPSLRAALERTFEFGDGLAIVAPSATSSKRRLFSKKRACPSCQRSFPELDPRLFSYNSPQGWCGDCQGTGRITYDDDTPPETCSSCDGTRLNPVALAVTLNGETIATLNDMSVIDAADYFAKMKLDGRAALIARDIMSELQARLQFLKDVGLGYLQMSRAAPTLSGGEAQRIRLASQLGSNLRGVCYILDEPTIGLHTRDNQRLLQTLLALQAQGNTVVVVEHDEDTIRAAQHVIDIGPGAGQRGGYVVATGTPKAIERHKDSLTGKMLKQPLAHPLRERWRDVNPRRKTTPVLRVEGARRNNLRRVNVSLPLGALVAVTGVSGSGKSSLIRGVVQDNLDQLIAARNARKRKMPDLVDCRSLDGWESIKRVLKVDQTPIGKTPRSCPATYVGFWDEIRKLFARTTEARIRGYTASRFSFNTAEGRCPECDGQGMRRIEMNFLPDVRVPCEACGGMRFAPDTLTIRYREKSIGDILLMSVEEAIPFFEAHPKIHHPLTLLNDVGLGYLTLGQPSPTLSGGEAQRIKLVTELARAKPSLEPGIQSVTDNPNHTLYVLDEPTIGLHMADVEKLIRVLHRLVDAGHSVFIVEHNLDIVAEADWIVDLGPEGGTEGGRIVAQGNPIQITEKPNKSLTGAALSKIFSVESG